MVGFDAHIKHSSLLCQYVYRIQKEDKLWITQ